MIDTNHSILTLPNGRAVAYADYGPRDATAVIWCHGGPGCRFEPAPCAAEAARAGLRLVGIDRPGYGRSTPQPRRTIGGWVDDALAVADELGLERFATVGVSTGGAYALALAAKSQRVLATVACCALTDMRWAEGKAMLAWREPIWSVDSREAALEAAEAQLGRGGAKVGTFEGVQLAPSDERLFADPVWANAWRALVSEMFAQGVGGYADDRLADGGGWHTFDVRRIRCPVVVLHGSSDTLVPEAHAQHTQRIVPGAALDVREGLGHFSILPEVAPALARLLAQGNGFTIRAYDHAARG